MYPSKTLEWFGGGQSGGIFTLWLKTSIPVGLWNSYLTLMLLLYNVVTIRYLFNSWTGFSYAQIMFQKLLHSSHHFTCHSIQPDSHCYSCALLMTFETSVLTTRWSYILIKHLTWAPALCVCVLTFFQTLQIIWGGTNIQLKLDCTRYLGTIIVTLVLYVKTFFLSLKVVECTSCLIVFTSDHFPV